MKTQRPTFAEIDLDALAENFKTIKKLTGGSVPVVATVKADAYGHGAAPVSRALAELGAWGFAVALVEEGAELREAGIEAPIFLLGCVPMRQIEDALNAGLILTVSDVDFAEELSATAERMSRRASVNIKIDTGMGRMGFWHEEAVARAREISQLPGIRIETVSTHFPSADEADLSFTREQIGLFRRLTPQITDATGLAPLAHAANSAAVMVAREAHLDLVRPGLMIYGLYSSPDLPRERGLKQVMTLKTEIVLLREVPKGRTLSYGRTFATARPSRIATLPVGYADGYFRAYSNRAEVLVRGLRAPVAGRVCMDQTLIDVTDVPGVMVGDEVVLYGSQGDAEIRIEEAAEWAGTIPYEVGTSVSKRVPRIYRGLGF